LSDKSPAALGQSRRIGAAFTFTPAQLADEAVELGRGIDGLQAQAFLQALAYGIANRAAGVAVRSASRPVMALFSRDSRFGTQKKTRRYQECFRRVAACMAFG